MECMYTNTENPGRYFGDNLKLTNWILDSGSNFHTKLEILSFITVSILETDRDIEVRDGNFVTKKGEVRRKMCDDKGKLFITTLYSVLSALN